MGHYQPRIFGFFLILVYKDLKYIKHASDKLKKMRR